MEQNLQKLGLAKQVFDATVEITVAAVGGGQPYTEERVAKFIETVYDTLAKKAKDMERLPK